MNALTIATTMALPFLALFALIAVVEIVMKWRR